MTSDATIPIRSTDLPETVPFVLRKRDWNAPSLFRPENMLREARRQKGLPATSVPKVCVLDPDGDIFAHAMATRRGERATGWACFHSELVTFDPAGVDDPAGEGDPPEAGERLGVVGRVVGAPYAVMVAEQLFASGCRFLISLSSAGQIADIAEPPYFVLIDHALRDEGTSCHYLPPAAEVAADPALIERVWPSLQELGDPVYRGGSWSTDAPFRETAEAVALARSRDLAVVEMEAAGLYAFAKARARDVLCLAHVSNRMGEPGDFGKGDDDGATASLRLIEAAARAWRRKEYQARHRQVAL